MAAFARELLVGAFPRAFRCGETPVLHLPRPEEFGAQPGICPNSLAEFGCSLSSAGS